jgi:hypothetical protein
MLIGILKSCVKYAQPKLLSLSGEYVIDKITYNNHNNSSLDMVILPGNTYYNLSETSPLDSISVGFTRIALDYSTIYFHPTFDQFNQTMSWGKKFPYRVHGQRTVYDLGYIVFNYDGTRRVWKILDDQLESLVIRTSGSYDIGNNNQGETTVFYLTRVGP